MRDNNSVGYGMYVLILWIAFERNVFDSQTAHDHVDGYNIAEDPEDMSMSV